MIRCTSRTFAFVFLILSAGLATPGLSQLPDPIYPTADAWTLAATPADLNMEGARLAEAQEYAERGPAVNELGEPADPLGAGLIVRRGYLVHQWGDTTYRFHTFSVTKGIGAILLGVANKEFGLTLDTRAQTIYPEFGVNPVENLATGHLDDVTLEQLATHTAGFENRSLPSPRFEHAPGTKWLYSDGGANWLADVLTARFTDDLASVLRSRVLDKIGVSLVVGGVGELDWRPVRNENSGPIGTAARRDFNAGIITSVDALARIGLLLERDGKWEGDQEILTAAFVDTLRKPVPSIAGKPIVDSNSQPDPDFPNVTAHFGLLWFNNADGAIANVPTDTYWAWGLGDHLIVVIPSLDLVIARTSGQPTPQQGGAQPRPWVRPQPCNAGRWCGRYEVLEDFLQPIVAAVNDAGEPPPPPPGAPAVTLTPSATQVAAGATVTLNWSAANATSCTASNGWSGAKATSGSESVTVAQTATYALACTGTGGTTQQSVTVTVASNPNPTPPGGGGGGGGGGALQWWMLIALLLAGTHGTMFANRRR